MDLFDLFMIPWLFESLGAPGFEATACHDSDVSVNSLFFIPEEVSSIFNILFTNVFLFVILIGIDTP